MNIHYLSQSTLISDSANSVHVCRMCDAFAALGHEVTLHALQGEGAEAAVRDYYGLRGAVRLRRHRFEAFAARAAARARTKLPGLGLGSLAAALQGRLQVRRELAAAAPELVYARSLEWLWAAVPPGAPFILECHAPPPHAAARRASKAVFRRPGFLGLVVISGPLKQVYATMFPDLEPERIMIAHDGADVPEISATPIRHARFQIGYVGHLYAGRGAELILELARRLPEAEFHFVGGTVPDIRRLRTGAPVNAIFHGHVAHAETARHYRAFDAVLAPYQRKVAVHGGAGDTSAFMSPLKLFEYMAWGKPILCSDHAVLREVLTDGKTALLLPPEDVTAWEAGLRRIIEDQEFAAALGARARAELERHYTWRGRCARILEWAGSNARLDVVAKLNR